MANDYTALDAEIIESIRDGCNKAIMLITRLEPATKPFQTANRCAMRVIDGRLQALRIAGKIYVNVRTKRWEVI